MKNEWLKFQASLTLEIGEELAKLFVASLHNKSKGNIGVAKELYFEIGLKWTPVILYWKEWVFREARYEPFLIMRDAKPLSVIQGASQWKKLWLNRENCGLSDELSGTATEIDPLLKDYLNQYGLLSRPFTFVDSGCWGTIVKEFHQCLGLRFQPLYFFSHNPYISGFLNQMGLKEEDGEVLNDSLECCFPNVVARPSCFQRSQNGRITPHLKRMDSLSIELGRAALRGVRGGVSKAMPSPLSAIERLLECSRLARQGEFTGILPYNSPTWSQGKKFLVEWPREFQWS